MFSQNSPEFTPAESRGLLPVSSAAVQHSEFLSGIEGTAKSLNHAVWLKKAEQDVFSFVLAKQLELGFQSCSVSTTATNSHK